MNSRFEDDFEEEDTTEEDTTETEEVHMRTQMEEAQSSERTLL